MRKHAGKVKVNLTENGLEETYDGLTQSILFDFDVKFNFTLTPPEVKFEK